MENTFRDDRFPRRFFWNREAKKALSDVAGMLAVAIQV